MHKVIWILISLICLNECFQKWQQLNFSILPKLNLQNKLLFISNLKKFNSSSIFDNWRFKNKAYRSNNWESLKILLLKSKSLPRIPSFIFVCIFL